MEINKTFLKALLVQYRILIFLTIILLIFTGFLYIYRYSGQYPGYSPSNNSRDLYAVGDENFPPFSYLQN